jgi:hypothetical protein
MDNSAITYARAVMTAVISANNEKKPLEKIFVDFLV